MWQEIWNIIKHYIGKLIATGGTLTLTVGTYTITIVFSEATGIKLTPESIDAIVRALISLLAGYSVWQNGVVKAFKPKYTKARYGEEKSILEF